MVLADFRNLFPEFVQTADAQVQATLNAAAAQIDINQWNGDGYDPTVTTTLTKADLGQGYLAAHMLTLSPYGQNARLNTKAGPMTTYWTHYMNLLRQVATPWLCV